MTKRKKVKKTEETPVEPVVESVVDIKPEVEEPVKVTEESALVKEIRKIYAADKARNPELYAAKNKDAQLERRIKAL